MKSKPKHSSNPVVSTPSSSDKPSLKVLLFTSNHPSVRFLMRAITQEGHLIVETVDDPQHLPHVIAGTTPHLIVAHFTEENRVRHLVHEAIGILFPDLPVLMVNGDLSETSSDWRTHLEAALNTPIQPENPRPYAEGARIVFHDESLVPFSKGKLNRQKTDEGGQSICSFQEARFVLQLQAARKNHIAARHYFACLKAQQHGLDQEIGYRLVHGSYKALSWSRDLCCKWLGLLAHYVPDAELPYLPLAGTPGPGVDYVHQSTPIEGVYAATLVLLSGTKPTIAEAIKQMVTARFDGQEDDTLLALSLHIYGLAKMLEQVGTAQIELMDAWLDPTLLLRPADENTPRGELRPAGIYRDFYDLTFILNSPGPLGAILKGFHAGTADVPRERFLPSFAEFQRLIKTRSFAATS